MTQRQAHLELSAFIHSVLGPVSSLLAWVFHSHSGLAGSHLSEPVPEECFFPRRSSCYLPPQLGQAQELAEGAWLWSVWPRFSSAPPVGLFVVVDLSSRNFSQLWRPEIWNQGFGRVGFLGGLSAWFADVHVLPVINDLSCVCPVVLFIWLLLYYLKTTSFSKNSPGKEWATLEIRGFSEMSTLNMVHFLLSELKILWGQVTFASRMGCHNFLPKFCFIYFCLFLLCPFSFMWG